MKREYPKHLICDQCSFVETTDPETIKKHCDETGEYFPKGSWVCSQCKKEENRK